MSRSHASTAPLRTPRLHIAGRIAVAVAGGYVFAWGFIAVVTALLCAAGMGFHDAEFLSTLLGVLAYLVVFLWTFVARRLWLVGLVLVGGGALLAALASLVQSLLV